MTNTQSESSDEVSWEGVSCADSALLELRERIGFISGKLEAHAQLFEERLTELRTEKEKIVAENKLLNEKTFALIEEVHELKANSDVVGSANCQNEGMSAARARRSETGSSASSRTQSEVE